MTDDAAIKLRDAAVQTFEELAFIFATGEDTLPEDPGPTRTVTVVFSGIWEGAIRLQTPSDMLAVVAAGMLGLDESVPVSAEQQDDALKELLNVICGNLLPVLAGREPVFRVGTPYIQTPDAPEQWDADKPAVAEVVVGLDEGWARLWYFEERPPATT